MGCVCLGSLCVWFLCLGCFCNNVYMSTSIDDSAAVRSGQIAF